MEETNMTGTDKRASHEVKHTEVKASPNVKRSEKKERVRK
jgi:hypothetical protein